MFPAVKLINPAVKLIYLADPLIYIADKLKHMADKLISVAATGKRYKAVNGAGGERVYSRARQANSYMNCIEPEVI